MLQHVCQRDLVDDIVTPVKSGQIFVQLHRSALTAAFYLPKFQAQVKVKKKIDFNVRFTKTWTDLA